MAPSDRSSVRVQVHHSLEVLDFDTWAAQYVRAVIAADQSARQLREAA